jgi:hypothetical protein
MNTTTIPADDQCPFPVEVTTEREPNCYHRLSRITVAPSFKATCTIDLDSNANVKKDAIDHLRGLLVRKFYANRSSEFFGLMCELEGLIYAPQPHFVDCLKVRDVLHKMAELMRYGQTKGKAE